MTGAGLRVADMASYLAATGWRRLPETWRGASVWANAAGYEALIPARDGLDDSDRRASEFLETLAKAESRTPEEIAEDIASPMMDTQSVRAFPRATPSGYVSLAAGLRALNGIRSMIAVAARSELEGQRLAYYGKHDGADSVLDVVQLGPTKPGSYIFTMRVPAERPAGQELLLDHRGYLPRRSLLRLSHAIGAAHEAIVSERGLPAFDLAVEAGVSANLCEALSDLSGIHRQEPFEVGFRWARGRPADVPSRSMAFSAGAGLVLRDAAARLRKLDSSGRAVVTGLVESLHDDRRGDDRRRIRVRGDMHSTDVNIRDERTIWLRLGPDDYERAVEAHLRRRPVRASGTKTQIGRRTELIVPTGGFELLD